MSAVKTIGRRLFSRATMGAPLVLKGVGGFTAPPIGAGVPISGGASTSPESLVPSFVERTWKAIRSGTKSESEHRDFAWAKRSMMGGLDPDLAVMNSMSHQHRVLRQLDRNKDQFDRERSIRATIIKAMGGNPEDFE